MELLDITNFDQASIDQEIEYWYEKALNAKIAAYIQSGILGGLQAITALIIIIIVVGCRKRKETFLVVTLVCLMFAGVFNCIGSFIIVFDHVIFDLHIN